MKVPCPPTGQLVQFDAASIESAALYSVGSSVYHRGRSEQLGEDAEDFRDWEREWRDRAQKWRDAADRARDNGDDWEAGEREGRASDFDELADEYARRAEEAERRAREQEEQAQAAEHEEQQRAQREGGETGREVHSVGPCPKIITGTRERDGGDEETGASCGPDDPSLSPPVEGSGMVCGPDITVPVLRVMDAMRDRYDDWEESEKTDRCRKLIDPRTATTAWDIIELSPNAAPICKDDFMGGGDEQYERYLQTDFWFEGEVEGCAIPRWPCGPTVVFLGQCIHAQVVNYVQWGVMTTLCDNETVAGLAHGARSLVNGVPDAIHSGQEAMTAIGSAFVESDLDGQSEAGQDAAQEALESALADMMTDEEFSAFGDRPEAACQMVCQPTPEQQEDIDSRNFDFNWGDTGRNR